MTDACSCAPANKKGKQDSAGLDMPPAILGELVKFELGTVLAVLLVRRRRRGEVVAGHASV